MPEPIENLRFSNQQDRLIIKAKVVNSFRRYEQKTGDNEAGGILLGNVYKDHNEIATITTPGRLDKFGKLFFIRSKKGAQPRINRAWKKSYGTLIYLGEWHTHSEANPTPSSEDKTMIKKGREETIMEIDFLYLIIVGQNETYWVGKQTKEGLIELKSQDSSA
jgi:integrative and conjugative element protein (TIGR02256 family)